MRRLADEIGALLMVDMAHPAGLIAAGLLDNPLRHAHIVTTTTHKTLRGTRGGMILLGKDFPNPWGKTTPKGQVRMMSSLLDMAVFPGTQGGPARTCHSRQGCGLRRSSETGVQSLPATGAHQRTRHGRSPHTARLQDRIRRHRQPLCAGGSPHKIPRPHLSKVAERALVDADITANKNMVPFDSRSPFQTSGIRFGTPKP